MESYGKISGPGKSWKITKISKVMEKNHNSQGKSWKNLWSRKVMENNKNIKSWKSQNFTLICVQNIVRDMAFFKIVRRCILPEKFARISTAEMVMENCEFYPNLDSKYSHRYVGFRHFQK